jgi:hypothetical protein
VAPRVRRLAFGSAAALTVAGVLCGALIAGTTGEALAIGLILIGLGGALLLMFLEVGLSEDRERAREADRRRRRAGQDVHWRRRRPPHR